MSVMRQLPTPSIWEQICQEVEKERKAIERGDSDGESVSYEASAHNPAFCGTMHAKIQSDFDPDTELDPAVGHPSCTGYWFRDMTNAIPVRTPTPPPIDRVACSNREYLEHYVWPCLLPALENMLKQAKLAGCFLNKKVNFNCIDFITEYLYNNNPHHKDREQLPLLDIPFVVAWHELHPRPPPIDTSEWSQDETAIKIQCAFRGYLVRKDPEVRELRKWQKEWRMINREPTITAEVSANSGSA